MGWRLRPPVPGRPKALPQLALRFCGRGKNGPGGLADLPSCNQEAGYVARGRMHRQMLQEELTAKWAAAFRRMADDLSIAP
jgi:hypothetical protein